MNGQRVLRRHYRRAVARAPYRPPPVARKPVGPGIVWALGCAAILALMLAAPAATLGAHLTRTLDTGVVGRYGVMALETIAAASPFGDRTGRGEIR